MGISRRLAIGELKDHKRIYTIIILVIALTMTSFMLENAYLNYMTQVVDDTTKLITSDAAIVDDDSNIRDLYGTAVELKNAGYNLTSKTLFIWEAVTQYISKEANDSTFKYIGQAAPGSKLVFSYILKSFIDGKYVHDGIKILAKKFLKKNNPLFIFGYNPADMKNYLLLAGEKTSS